MPITTQHLREALPKTPEELFTAAANRQLSDRITMICNGLTTDHQRDPNRIRHIADHANTALGTYEKQRNVSAEADRMATAEVANAVPLINQIMGDLNRSGLAGPGGIDPVAFRTALEAELTKDLKTAIDNTLQQQYKEVVRQERNTDIQREQELNQYNRRAENIAASSRWWTRASIIGSSVVAVAGLTTFVSGNIFAAAVWVFPVGAAAAVAWFVLPPVVGWIRKQLQPPFQPRNAPANQGPNNPQGPNRPPPGPNPPPPGPNNPPGPNPPPPGPNNPPGPNPPPPGPNNPPGPNTPPTGPQNPQRPNTPAPVPTPPTTSPDPAASQAASPTPTKEEDKLANNWVFVARPRVPRPPSPTEPVAESPSKSASPEVTGSRVQAYSEEDLVASTSKEPPRENSKGEEQVH